MEGIITLNISSWFFNRNLSIYECPYNSLLFCFSAARLETFMFENIPVDKIGVTNKRLTNLEYMGQDMIEAGNEFGAGTPYGNCL